MQPTGRRTKRSLVAAGTTRTMEQTRDGRLGTVRVEEERVHVLENAKIGEEAQLVVGGVGAGGRSGGMLSRHLRAS
eukprot:scaffold1239_cov270-Pavlova_lutheri.AAC.4